MLEIDQAWLAKIHTCIHTYIQKFIISWFYS